MSKIKQHYLGNMTQNEIDTYLYNKHARDVEYEEWLQSDEYVNLVNSELENTKLVYSEWEVTNAIQYGVNSIILPAEEIGTEVYGKLLYEKVFEYLNKSYERN
jgi:hypothetical protein